MIEVKRLSVGFDGKKAVDDVSFRVGRGDYLCVVGENGSGKTTLMKAALRLLKPDCGEVIFDGIERREIGYLPQRAVIQRDFPASVYEVVLSGCLNRRFLPFFSGKDRERAAECLKSLGIDGLKRKAYRELSGGQQQRALLARALCAAEKLIVLDEPTSGLDPAAAAETYLLLKKLNERGTAVIMVSHDIPGAVKYGGNILHMTKGSAIFFGSAGDYTRTDIYRKSGGEAN
ncbi:MAG: ATP-binding cassette domain-containing protein [Clostridiales bacterium]|jgi:zinc transport system ATP-binding protein|nr:ATP-binding cassette domain-containing protein [Clostridiales bacterium]